MSIDFDDTENIGDFDRNRHLRMVGVEARLEYGEEQMGTSSSSKMRTEHHSLLSKQADMLNSNNKFKCIVASQKKERKFPGTSQKRRN